MSGRLERDRLVQLNQVAAEAVQGHEKTMALDPTEVMDLTNAALAYLKAPEAWKPIGEAPDHRLVLVRGHSGYMHHKTYYCAAYKDPSWHDGEFNDATGTRLSDRFGKHGAPTEWRDIP